MQRWALHPHPQFPAPAVRAVHASLSAVGQRVRISFEIDADPRALSWPGPAVPAFRDGLWRHSCLELFATDAGQGYREFNFAPSGEFAAYEFDAYRTNMRPLALGTPGILRGADKDQLGIEVQMPAEWLGATSVEPRAIGLTAVLEAINGSHSYWALRHPGDKPDFHHRDGFIAGWPPARA